MIKHYILINILCLTSFVCFLQQANIWTIEETEKLTSREYTCSLLDRTQLTCLAPIPGTKYILVGTNDKGLVAIDRSNQTITPFFPEHKDLAQSTITSIASAHHCNGLTFATLGRIWIMYITPNNDNDFYRSAVIRNKGRATALSVAFHPTQNMVATGHGDGMVRIWDIQSLTPACIIRKTCTLQQKPWKPIKALHFCDAFDSNVLCYSSRAKTIILQDLRCLPQKSVSMLTKVHDGPITALVSTKYGTLISGGTDGFVCISDLRQPKAAQQKFQLGSSITSIALSPVYKTFWVGQENGVCSLIQPAAPRRHHAILAHKAGGVSDLIVRSESPDRTAISAGKNGTICILHLTTQRHKVEPPPFIL